jgi:hypothetical protein
MTTGDAVHDCCRAVVLYKPRDRQVPSQSTKTRGFHGRVRDLSKCSWRLFRMRTSLVATLVLVALASCTGTQSEERLPAPSPSPSAENVSSSPHSSAGFSGRITDCEGLRVPRVELDTTLDRRAGLLTVNYTTRRHARNRSFTIAYDDPSCGQNPEVQKSSETSGSAVSTSRFSKKTTAAKRSTLAGKQSKATGRRGSRGGR